MAGRRPKLDWDGVQEHLKELRQRGLTLQEIQVEIESKYGVKVSLGLLSQKFAKWFGYARVYNRKQESVNAN